MNKVEADVISTVLSYFISNQRDIAKFSGYSLGSVNKAVKSLVNSGYLSGDLKPTDAAQAFYDENKPKNAIILAAGMGLRLVPINTLKPKSLLEVKGEILIEHQINELHAAGITDITVVVGFMKDSFEYLIDKYGVRLVVNTEYAAKNNLHSLCLAADKINGTYIVPCDIWCDKNPFSSHELYSFYMLSEKTDDCSEVRVNRKGEIVKVGKHKNGNGMIGISYISAADAPKIKNRIKELDASGENDGDFWETALYSGDKMIIPAKVVPESEAVEINFYEQLRELDNGSKDLKSDAIDIICDVFGVTPDKITNIETLKKGMTNRSFLFSVNGDKYIMRIPGEGTNMLINRREEAEVFKTISGLGFCDDPVYINPQNGYKITKFLDNIRVCDPENEADLKLCMKKLKGFHEMKLIVPHSFDIFGQIEFYESLWNGNQSVFRDYKETKERVLSLKDYIDKQDKDFCLTHIDAVPDNFLFYTKQDGSEGLQLTDWEYAGMQDPHVDIAMFCIYSMYDKKQIDRLIDIYFEGKCDIPTRKKIYCYIAACGLLWSNWCEYKRTFGIEFGEYSLYQYRYAKDFYKYAKGGE